jgi:hypothetical protein
MTKPVNDLKLSRPQEALLRKLGENVLLPDHLTIWRPGDWAHVSWCEITAKGRAWLAAHPERETA